MREEISEPQQWRSSRLRSSEVNSSWAARRKMPEQISEAMPALAEEAIDAAFAEESIGVEPVRGSRRDLASLRTAAQTSPTGQSQTPEGSSLLHDISAQLAMLQTQQEHLQRLLDQAQG